MLCVLALADEGPFGSASQLLERVDRVRDVVEHARAEDDVEAVPTDPIPQDLHIAAYETDR